VSVANKKDGTIIHNQIEMLELNYQAFSCTRSHLIDSLKWREFLMDGSSVKDERNDFGWNSNSK